MDIPALTTGSPLARALYEVYAGTPAIVLKSPPGAGKTQLIVELIEQLFARGEVMSIVVATPTRRAATSAAMRIGAQLNAAGARTHEDEFVVGLQASVAITCDEAELEETGVRVGVGPEPGSVFVCTVAAAKQSQEAGVDLMIFDEAYQVTFADFSHAAQPAAQVLLVGDPGQIGPVVKVARTAFEFDPTRSCPEVVVRRKYTQQIAMETTWRLGAESVSVIAPLYDFEFSSARPRRHLTLASGQALGEIETAVVDSSAGKENMEAMGQVLDLAQELIGGRVDSEVLDGTDVAIVVSHRSQVAALSALVAERGLEIAVGTADAMQGGQWHGVVALDPLFGKSAATGHAADLGRLCVMLSRHRTHLTWVHDDQALGLLEDGDVAARIRRALILP